MFNKCLYLNGNEHTIEVGVAPEIVSSGALKMDREASILSFKKARALLS